MNSNLLAFRAAMLLPYIEPALPFDPDDFERHGPYPHQLALLRQVVERVRQGYRRILVQLPTGGGKTKLATCLLASAASAHFVVHRKELIEQTSAAFSKAGIAHSFVAAGKPMDPEAEVLLCGIATLATRLGVVLPSEIVIYDEAHHIVASTWSDVMAAYPDALHIGLTATPQRLDGRGLGDCFDTMVLGPSTRWLIQNRYLSDYDYYAPPPAAEDDNALLGNVVEHYLRLAPGQPGIVFAANRTHGRDLTAEFVRQRVRAVFVDGSMSDKQRTAADRMFRSGEAQMFVNVNIVGEGYDVPNVVYCGIARRTQSLSWFRQMVGRALRAVYAPGFDLSTVAGRAEAMMRSTKQRAILCDHGNNLFYHGLPDDDIAWSLEGRARGAGAGRNSDADPIHQCLTCYRVTPSSVRVCPGCGTEFPTKTRNLRLRDGDLVRIEREAAEAARKAAAIEKKREERACATFDDFVQLHKRRGYNGDPRKWAKMKMRFRSTWKSAA